MFGRLNNKKGVYSLNISCKTIVAAGAVVETKVSAIRHTIFGQKPGNICSVGTTETACSRTVLLRKTLEHKVNLNMIQLTVMMSSASKIMFQLHYFEKVCSLNIMKTKKIISRDA